MLLFQNKTAPPPDWSRWSKASSRVIGQPIGKPLGIGSTLLAIALLSLTVGRTSHVHHLQRPSVMMRDHRSVYIKAGDDNSQVRTCLHTFMVSAILRSS